MSEMEILQAAGVVLGSGVAAEVLRLLIPGTKHDSKAVRVLRVVSKVLTLGLTSMVRSNGRQKR